MTVAHPLVEDADRAAQATRLRASRADDSQGARVPNPTYPETEVAYPVARWPGPPRYENTEQTACLPRLRLAPRGGAYSWVSRSREGHRRTGNQLQIRHVPAAVPSPGTRWGFSLRHSSGSAVTDLRPLVKEWWSVSGQTASRSQKAKTTRRPRNSSTSSRRVTTAVRLDCKRRRVSREGRNAKGPARRQVASTKCE